jgi:hypothetical protein
MKKTYLALALITGLLVVGNAYGEDEVYYCAEIDSNGFVYDKALASYKRAWFKPRKFKIKLDRTANSIVMVRDGECQVVGDGWLNTMSIKLPSHLPISSLPLKTLNSIFNRPTLGMTQRETKSKMIMGFLGSWTLPLIRKIFLPASFSVGSEK